MLYLSSLFLKYRIYGISECKIKLIIKPNLCNFAFYSGISHIKYKNITDFNLCCFVFTFLCKPLWYFCLHILTKSFEKSRYGFKDRRQLTHRRLLLCCSGCDFDGQMTIELCLKGPLFSKCWGYWKYHCSDLSILVVESCFTLFDQVLSSH